MKNYKITRGTGTIMADIVVVQIEDFECEQDALDKLIDQKQKEGDKDVIPFEQAVKEGLFPDEYAIGGNEGMALIHYGTFGIELMDEDKTPPTEFECLQHHVGHTIRCVGYGDGEIINVAIECEDCNEVLYSLDKYTESHE